MWISAIKSAFQAGSHIYKNRQKTKMLMADAQMRQAEKMANGAGSKLGAVTPQPWYANDDASK